MSDKIKNIISNIIGSIALIASFVYLLEFDLELIKFGAGLLSSGILFLYKADQTRDFIKRIFDKKLQ